MIVKTSLLARLEATPVMPQSGMKGGLPSFAASFGERAAELNPSRMSSGLTAGVDDSAKAKAPLSASKNSLAQTVGKEIPAGIEEAESEKQIEPEGTVVRQPLQSLQKQAETPATGLEEQPVAQAGVKVSASSSGLSALQLRSDEPVDERVKEPTAPGGSERGDGAAVGGTRTGDTTEKTRTHKKTREAGISSKGEVTKPAVSVQPENSQDKQSDGVAAVGRPELAAKADRTDALPAISNRPAVATTRFDTRNVETGNEAFLRTSVSGASSATGASTHKEVRSTRTEVQGNEHANVAPQPTETSKSTHAFSAVATRAGFEDAPAGQMQMQVTPTVARMGGHQTSGVHQVSGQRTSAPPQGIVPVSAEPMPFKATPTTLEVGIPGGAHGWLKVRAEISGDGTISASLASGSQSGQQMLHRALPSLTAFLQSESVKVGSLSVHPGTSLTDQSVSSRGSENSGDLGQHKGSAQGDDRQPSSPMGTVKGQQASGGDEWNAAPVDEWILSAAHSNSGGWLSVMA